MYIFFHSFFITLILHCCYPTEIKRKIHALVAPEGRRAHPPHLFRSGRAAAARVLGSVIVTSVVLDVSEVPHVLRDDVDVNLCRPRRYDTRHLPPSAVCRKLRVAASVFASAAVEKGKVRKSPESQSLFRTHSQRERLRARVHSLDEPEFRWHAIEPRQKLLKVARGQWLVQMHLQGMPARGRRQMDSSIPLHNVAP